MITCNVAQRRDCRSLYCTLSFVDWIAACNKFPQNWNFKFKSSFPETCSHLQTFGLWKSRDIAWNMSDTRKHDKLIKHYLPPFLKPSLVDPRWSSWFSGQLRSNPENKHQLLKTSIHTSFLKKKRTHKHHLGLGLTCMEMKATEHQ
jgi:hypothetical protein